jgi:DNA-binding NtrC family response regulator
LLQAQADIYEEPRRYLSEAALHTLMQYSWPGNVRELANAMEAAHALARGETIEPADLPPSVQSASRAAEPTSDLCLVEVERRTIVEALRRTKHCKAAASRLLGINIQRLNRRMASLDIPLA